MPPPAFSWSHRRLRLALLSFPESALPRARFSCFHLGSAPFPNLTLVASPAFSMGRPTARSSSRFRRRTRVSQMLGVGYSFRWSNSTHVFLYGAGLTLGRHSN